MDWNNKEPPDPIVILYHKEIKGTWLGIKPAESGLVNLGNSCFLNASLQALMHLPSFVDFLVGDISHRSKCISLLSCVICSLYRTYLNMSLHPTFKPGGIFYLLPMIRSTLIRYQQHDAHEFLVCLLEKVEADLIKRWDFEPDFCSKQTTAIGQIFTGWMQINDSCVECHTISTKYEPVSIMSLSVDYASIQLAVDTYLNKEEIIGEFQCDLKCTSHKCVRSITHHTYPKVLRIVFCRFDARDNKISSPVHIDRIIEVGNATYHFVSAIIHEGDTVLEGHYTSVAVNFKGKMTHYNDSIVTENYQYLNCETNTCGIYVAFYQLHHLKAVSLKRSPPNTPSKAVSPLHKKMHGPQLKSPLKSPRMKSLEKNTKGNGKIFSPKKFKRKFGQLIHTVFPSIIKNKNVATETETLAQPMIVVVNDTPVEVLTPPIIAKRRKSLVSLGSASSTPFNLPPNAGNMELGTSEKTSVSHQKKLLLPVDRSPLTRRSLLFNTTSTQSDLECQEAPQDVNSEASAAAVVSPLKISLMPRTDMKGMNIASSIDSEATATAIVSPLKISMIPATVIQGMKTPSSLDSEATASAMVSPIKISLIDKQPRLPPIRISWKERTAAKSRDSQSDHEYMLNPLSPLDQQKTSIPSTVVQGLNTLSTFDSETKIADAIVTPIERLLETTTNVRPLDAPSQATQARKEPVVAPMPISSKESQAFITNRLYKQPRLPPIRISWKQRTAAKSRDSQSDHEYMLNPRLPPIRISWKERTAAKSRDSQSDHEYMLNPLSPLDQQETTIPDDMAVEVGFTQPGYVPVHLTAADVPEATLPNPIIEKNTNDQLRTWLKWRGIPYSKVNKQTLVARVRNCMIVGDHNILDPQVDGGKMYNEKRRNLQLSQDVTQLTDADLFPEFGWDSFPSRDIPHNFNFGSVFHYLVETMPQMADLNPSTLSSSDEEEEEELQVTINNPFEDAVCKEIRCSKKLRRGLQYVKSNFVLQVEDTLPDRIHAYKAVVRASMHKQAYIVKVALSQISGRVVKCSCDVDCPQNNFGRCSKCSTALHSAAQNIEWSPSNFQYIGLKTLDT